MSVILQPHQCFVFYMLTHKTLMCLNIKKNPDNFSFGIETCSNAECLSLNKIVSVGHVLFCP